MMHAQPEPGTEEEEELLRLMSKIQRDRGFHCGSYKNKCVRRRIQVRMRARSTSTYGAYSDLLDRDAGEYDLLLDALTINVTKFFRNARVWEKIESRVIPELFDAPGGASIWSAGCATGEEIYSVSILLHERARALGREAHLERFQLLGTDIDARSLEAARRAEFPELSLVEMPAAIRERWISADGPPFRLAAEARANVRFERHDLLHEPVRERFSLVLCRNVLIYFEREVQSEVFRLLYDALLPGGFLVLGEVESLFGRPRSLLNAVEQRARIFRRPG